MYNTLPHSVRKAAARHEEERLQETASRRLMHSASLPTLKPSNASDHRPTSTHKLPEPSKSPGNAICTQSNNKQGTENTPTSNAAPVAQPVDDNVETLEGCQTYTFRRGGDTLTLYVGSKEKKNGVKTIVCSDDLVRHLSQEWKEVCKKSKLRGLPPRKQISLTDDNPNMMALVMKIAHGKHRGIKESLSFDELLDLARISHRYQTNELLVFPLPVWTKRHKQRILQPGYEQWMFISYQFGLEDDYLKLARHLALNCRANANGDLLTLAGDEVLTGEFSEGALSKYFLLPFTPHLLNGTFDAEQHTDRHQRKLKRSASTSCTHSSTPCTAMSTA